LKIEATSKNTVVISLSSHDLEELGITYDDMDYKNLETRRVIYTLLEEANKTLGKDFHPSGKMLIEAIPDPFGGCVLYFTVYQSDADKEALIPVVTPFVFLCEFKGENGLIDASRAILSEILKPPESKLYSNGTDYRLLFKSFSNHGKLKSILREYSDGMTESNTKIAHTKEHWNCLCDKNAIEKLGVV
jgi:negative regulator of genetic competence, sporulation and motility